MDKKISKREFRSRFRLLSIFVFISLPFIILLTSPNQATYQAETIEPNDPWWSTQWGLVQSGLPRAWVFKTELDRTFVALLDGGVAFDPEVEPNIWREKSYDFRLDSPIVQPVGFHGLHMAKIIGSIGNNGSEGAGVFWHGKIVDFCISNSEGTIDVGLAIKAMDRTIALARETGMKAVVCAAYSKVSSPSDLERQAIQRLRDAGVLFISGAGNDFGNNNDLNPTYPANYGLDNQITAGARQSDGTISPASNIGPQSVHLFAPSSSIVVQNPDGSFVSFNRTSAATAFTAGIAALLTDSDQFADYRAVKQRIMCSVQKENLPCISGGFIRADRAFENILNLEEPDVLSQLFAKAKPGKVTFMCVSSRQGYSPTLSVSLGGRLVGTMQYDAQDKKYMLVQKMKPKLKPDIYRYEITSSLGGMVDGTVKVK